MTCCALFSRRCSSTAVRTDTRCRVTGRIARTGKKNSFTPNDKSSFFRIPPDDSSVNETATEVASCSHSLQRIANEWTGLHENKSPATLSATHARVWCLPGHHRLRHAHHP